MSDVNMVTVECSDLGVFIHTMNTLHIKGYDQEFGGRYLTDPGIVVPPRLEALGEGHAEGGVVGVVVHQVVVAAPVPGAEVVVVGVVQVTRGIPTQ